MMRFTNNSATNLVKVYELSLFQYYLWWAQLNEMSKKKCWIILTVMTAVTKNSKKTTFKWSGPLCRLQVEIVYKNEWSKKTTEVFGPQQPYK